MSQTQALTCADCQQVMERIEELPHPTMKCRWLEFYRCTNTTCARKVVLQWERPDGVLTDHDISWVEREVMNRGSWFPSDTY